MKFFPDHSGNEKMNIFEDLIDELKEQNLIEQTVIETSELEEESKKSDVQLTDPIVKPIEVKVSKPAAAKLPHRENPISEKDSLLDKSKTIIVENNSSDPVKDLEKDVAKSDSVEPLDNGAEFYRQRATNEVSFLQTVESAFAGIEREQLKIVPRPFDDLKVKMVLHSFLQVSRDADSTEYAKVEFKLLSETESWYSSLSLRDARIMTAHLRRYCETTRPQLSAPALVALARFYRNSPYSEQVRSKFDLIMTRLFSKESDGNRRETVFERDELIRHIQELYADWSSVPLYSTEKNDVEIQQIAQNFESFAAEAAAAQRFDDLINRNFFNRLRIFKENSNENFYAPVVAAAGIECNILVGNCYIELLEKEKALGNTAVLENKYGLSHDQVISEATGKTLLLIELIKEKKSVPPVEEKNVVVLEPIDEENNSPKKSVERSANNAVKSKKWMISLAVILIIAAVAFYLGNKSSSLTKVQESANASKLDIENSMLGEHLSEARIQDATLKGVVLATWNHLTTEKKKDILKQISSFGGDKGYKKVQLNDKEGKAVGTVIDGNITVLD